MLDPVLNPVYYVTGPLRSGKTTGLRNWHAGRLDVAGLFQPVIGGKRYLVDIRTGDNALMEAGADETDVQVIGRFRFAGSVFAWAAEVLLKAASTPEARFIILDEIGPLELRGEGMDGAIKRLALEAGPGLSLVLVVRESLLEAILDRYGVAGKAVAFDYPE